MPCAPQVGDGAVMRPRLAVVWLVLAVVAGLATVATATLGLSRPRPIASFGSLTPPAVAPAVSSPVRASRDPSSRAVVPPVAVRPGVPMSLTIASLGVRAVIRPVAVTEGVLGVPDDPAEVGWWSGSALAGSGSGSVVLDGHVDSATLGVGALFRLAQLGPGAVVAVGTDAGSSVRYRVTARRELDKASGLPPDLFRRSGAPQLVVITCGGAFDRQMLSYRDNVVVAATPAR